MDEKELRFSLQVHLSQYAKVMYVKIHHGKDGGMCAFVQFEVSLERLYFLSFMLIYAP